MSNNLEVVQISNHVYCDSKLNQMDIENRLLPNPYYDYPYLIINDFLDENEINAINQYIKEDSEFKTAKLRTKSSESILDKVVDKKIRNTNIYKLDETLENLYFSKFNNIQKTIEDYFKLAITSSTDIQALEYHKGYFYKAHSDDSSMLFDGDELIGFSLVARQRKITTVLFTKSCDEDFTGGELKFNFLYDVNMNNIIYKPRKGDMLVFLSNPYFTHEVLEVQSGTRITLVQWHNGFGD